MSEPANDPEDAPATLEEMEESAHRSRKLDKRVKWTLFWALMIGGLVAFFWLGQVTADRDVAKAEAASEQQAKKDIAVTAQAALCQAGDVDVYDAELCDQLEAIAEEPSRTEQGPQGIQGTQGIPGQRGADGVNGRDGQPGPLGPVGPTGTDGLNGIDGLGFTGLTGATGPAGKDSTVPGPAGKDGKDGTPGADGSNGRGISSVTCEGVGDTSYWLVTYDDGTTQTSGGPCRVQATIIPAPTEAP